MKVAKPVKWMSLLGIFLLASAVWGQATQPDGKVEISIAHCSEPNAGVAMDAGAKIEAVRDQFMSEMKVTDSDGDEQSLALGVNGKAGLYVGWGAAPIDIPPLDARWGHARIVAYEQALIQAEADFVEIQQLSIVTNTFAERLNDSLGTPLPQSGASHTDVQQSGEDLKKELTEKALALGSAKLDEQLRVAGVDPNQFSNKPKEQKAIIFAKAFWKQCLTKSFGNLVGVRVLQTFEGNDAKGGWEVGVLIAQSPKMKQLAETIAQGKAASRGLLPHDLPIKDQVTKPDVDLLMDFGVRTLVDEHGDPCIIAFGQYPVPNVNNTDPDVVADMQRDANKMARMLAQSAISEFANGEVQENSSDFTYSEDKNVDSFGVKAVDVAAALHERFQKSANLKITGLTTIRTFRAKHPKTGQEFVGVVLAWSPTTQDNAVRVVRPPDSTGVGTATPGAVKGNNYDKHLNDY